MATTTVNGTSLSYRDTGSGEIAVVFVHAFPLSAEMWVPQIEALRDRYRCIAPDLKGFGASDAPDDPQAYSVESYVAELKGLIDGLGLGRVVLVGLSMGGYVCLTYLRSFPGTLAGVVLADTRAEADTPEILDKRTAQQQVVREQGTGPLLDALPKALLAPTTWENKRDVVERITRLMDQPAAGFVGALEAIKQRPDSTAELVSIRIPTLVLVGEHDGITPPEAARKMHEHIGGSRLVVIPDAGHLSNLEAPDAFNGALQEFLGEIEASAG